MNTLYLGMAILFFKKRLVNEIKKAGIIAKQKEKGSGMIEFTLIKYFKFK
jgi:hypothetical protein